MNCKILREKHPHLSNYTNEKIIEEVDLALNFYHKFKENTRLIFENDNIENNLNEHISLLNELNKSNTSNLNKQVEMINVSINDLKAHLSNKFSSVDNLSENLISTFSLSNKSVIKGNVSEHIFENIIEKYFPSIPIERTADVKKFGDYLLKIKDCDVIVDIKNYTQPVPKKEIVKLKNDMELHKINFGMIVSLNSSISGKNKFGYEKIDDNSYLIYISKATEESIIWSILLLDILIPLIKTNNNTLENDNVYEILGNLFNSFQEIYSKLQDICVNYGKKKEKIIREVNEIDENISSLEKCVKSMINSYGEVIEKLYK